MTSKHIVAIVIAAVLGIALIGAYYYPQAGEQAVESSAGTTFNSAKYAGKVALLTTPGANGTSTSILNSDAYDRIVTNVRSACQGVGTSLTAYSGTGLAALTLTIATSSTAAPATNGNTNSVGGGAVTIGTSTANWAVATSSATGAGSNAVYNTWAAGSYLTFTTNATNTATCTFGVDYIGS